MTPLRLTALALAVLLPLSLSACGSSTGGSGTGGGITAGTSAPAGGASTPVSPSGSSSLGALAGSTAPSASSSGGSGVSAVPGGGSGGGGGGSAPASLHNFKVVDMSFIGSDDAWAIGTANCLSGSGTCPAMERTTDGGQTWTSMKQPGAAKVGDQYCDNGCISHVRFASTEIGYAFSPSALYMTTNGGSSWAKLSGGAYALESADGNVVRIVADNGPNCLPGCTFSVETAPNGSNTWHNVALPDGGQSGSSGGIDLQRQGSDLYLIMYGHVAGGAQTAYSIFDVSTNDGKNWHMYNNDPCPQSGSTEMDSSSLAASGNAVAVLCSPRDSSGPSFTAESTNAGTTFHGGSATALGAQPYAAAFAMATPLTMIVVSNTSKRSIDGGRTWSPIADTTIDGGNVTFIGFESSTTGRVAVDNGSTLLTTHDAGATWTIFTFPS